MKGLIEKLAEGLCGNKDNEKAQDAAKSLLPIFREFIKEFNISTPEMDTGKEQLAYQKGVEDFRDALLAELEDKE